MGVCNLIKYSVYLSICPLINKHWAVVTEWKKQNQILRKQHDNAITFVKSFHKLVPIKLKFLDTVNVCNDKNANSVDIILE